MIRKNITRITNRIHGDIAAAFPEFSDLMGVDSSAGIAILEEYSTPDVIAMADPDKVLKIMRRAGRTTTVRKMLQRSLMQQRTPLEYLIQGVFTDTG